MEFVSATSHALSPEVLTGIARYRHRVFVETLGWPLSSPDGLETDQFDRPDTRYIMARHESDGRLVGIARLLPTDRPYLLGEVFPQLMGDAPLPRSAEVWELSRFAAVDFDAAVDPPDPQFSSPITLGLLHQAMRVAVAHGVTRLITVSPLGVERLLRRTGYAAHRAAPPVVVDGHPLFACWIEVQGPLSS